MGLFDLRNFVRSAGDGVRFQYHYHYQ